MRRKEAWKRTLAWMLAAAMAVGTPLAALAEEAFPDAAAQEEQLIVAEEEVPEEETDVSGGAEADTAKIASAEEAPQLSVADIETVAETVEGSEDDPAASAPTPLEVGKTVTVTVDENNEAHFSFTPSESGVYLFSGKAAEEQYNGEDYFRNLTVEDAEGYSPDIWDKTDDSSVLALLSAGVSYSCVMELDIFEEEGEAKPSVTVSLTRPEIASVQAGVEKSIGSGALDRWTKFIPEESALYEWTGADESDMMFYDGDFGNMDNAAISIYANQFYLSKDKTYYCYVWGDAQKIGIDKVRVDSFVLNTAYSVSQDCWFSFVPEKTNAYRISSEGLTDFDGDVDLFSDGNFEELLGYTGVYGGVISDSFSLEQGKKYYFHISSGINKTFSPFKLTLSKEKSVQSLQLYEDSDLTYEVGSHMVVEMGEIVYDDNSFYTVWLGVGYSDYDDLGYQVKGSLYEANADGSPNLARQVSADPDTEEVELKAGSYVLVAEIGTVDENDNFTRLPDIAPLYVKILVNQAHTHTYETVTDTPATCETPGSTVKRCTTCGEVDEASRTTVPPTGHTGGTATCVARAVCSVCGKEYGELLPGTLSLNVSSLTLNTKQKTTELTVVEMGAGDSILSVESDNTSVLKAELADGKITLTAKKKEGIANVKVTLASGVSKTVSVTVQKKAVATKSIKGIKKKLTMKKRQKITLKPKLKPGNSTDKIKFSSSNKKVAAVNGKGVVTAKKAGKATITVKAGKKSVKCKITVK